MKLALVVVWYALALTTIVLAAQDAWGWAWLPLAGMTALCLAVAVIRR